MYEVLYLFNTGFFQWNPNIMVSDPLLRNILFCQSIQSQDVTDIWKSYECLIFFMEKYHHLIQYWTGAQKTYVLLLAYQITSDKRLHLHRSFLNCKNGGEGNIAAGFLRMVPNLLRISKAIQELSISCSKTKSSSSKLKE